MPLKPWVDAKASLSLTESATPALFKASARKYARSYPSALNASASLLYFALNAS